jgi:hypothetical protein
VCVEGGAVEQAGGPEAGKDPPADKAAAVAAAAAVGVRSAAAAAAAPVSIITLEHLVTVC